MQNLKRKSLKYGKGLLLSLCSGILMTLAFPSYDYYFLAFFALVPLLIVVNTKGFVHSGLAVIVFVISFYYNFLDWIKVFHPLALPGLVFYLCVIHLIPFFIFKWMKRGKEGIYNVVLFTTIMVIFEYLREQGFAKFPYGVIAYSQYKFLPFIQVSNLFGHLSISFFIYFVNASIADYIVNKIWGEERFNSETFFSSFRSTVFNRFTLSAVFFLAMLIYGNYQLKGDSNIIEQKINKTIETIMNWLGDEGDDSLNIKRQKVKPEKDKFMQIGIIQPWYDYNLPWTTENKFRLFEKLTKLTYQAMDESVTNGNPIELMVWPESSIADYYEYRINKGKGNSFAEAYQRFFKEFGKKYPNVKFITGALSLGEINHSQVLVEKKARSGKDAKTGSIGGKVKKYNSALLIDKDGKVQGRSAKKYLVPVAEYFPYQQILNGIPWFAAILRQAQASNFTPFEHEYIFNLKKGNFAILVCYEDTFFDLSRNFTLKGANFLIVVTNDAWSYTIKSQEIHYAFIFFRAIENQRFFVRAGNAGVTGFIGPLGKEYQLLPQFKEGYTMMEIPMRKDISIFTQYGNIFIIGIFLLFIVFNFVFIFTRILWLLIVIISGIVKFFRLFNPSAGSINRVKKTKEMSRKGEKS